MARLAITLWSNCLQQLDLLASGEEVDETRLAQQLDRSLELPLSGASAITVVLDLQVSRPTL